MASKNPPSAIVSGAGWLMQFAIGVSEELIARGWSNGDIHSLVTARGKGNMGLCVNAFADAFKMPIVSWCDLLTRKFAWEVDYDEPLSEKLKGRCPDIICRVTGHATDENFPDNRTGKRLVTGKILSLRSESLESFRL